MIPYPTAELLLPAFWGVREFGEDSFYPFNDNLLLLELIECGFPAQFRGELDGTSERQLANRFTLQ